MFCFPGHPPGTPAASLSSTLAFPCSQLGPGWGRGLAPGQGQGESAEPRQQSRHPPDLPRQSGKPRKSLERGPSHSFSSSSFSSSCRWTKSGPPTPSLPHQMREQFWTSSSAGTTSSRGALPCEILRPNRAARPCPWFLKYALGAKCSPGSILPRKRCETGATLEPRPRRQGWRSSSWNRKPSNQMPCTSPRTLSRSKAPWC
mmetsp:Transcript_1533/g.4425  ORF Transcript_1533/g.4425 Transcript_1533/m.4425 type:complete len:202 (+) Transcript_1533:763-1368(+)